MATDLNYTLQHSLREWEATFDSITDRISLLDRDFRIVKCNKAYAEALGKAPRELIGRTCYELMHNAATPIDACPHRATLQDGKTARYQIDKKETNEFFEVTTSPWHNETGKLVGTIHVVKDISARVRATMDLERAIERANSLTVQAELATVAKSQFLATMSHEIRTPLNGIIGMTELLLDTQLTEEQRNFVQIVSVSSNSLLSIIEEILDFSRIEAGKMRLEERPIDFRKIVAEVLDMLSLKAREKNLRFSAHFGSSRPEMLLGDATRLRQIILNLANNAIKFTETGSVTIDVQCVSTRDNAVTLTVSVIDTGIGIDEEDKAKLFNRFSQIDNSMDRKYSGTGLGLAICKKIVEMLNGSIGVKSEPGKGSTFYFTLTLRCASAADTVTCNHQEKAAIVAPDVQKLPPPVSRGTDVLGNVSKSVRILVAEDNEINLLVTRKTLESLGFFVECVVNGAQAVDKLCQGQYDCVFLDIHMPVMDGVAAAKKIRDPASAVLNHAVPLIVLTASTEKHEHTYCREAGVNQILVKPIRREDIISALAPMLKQRAAGLAPETLKPALDTAELLQTLDNDRDLYAQILDRFIKGAHDQLASIKASLAAQNACEARRIAHVLKGASLNVGAREMAVLTAQLETACGLDAQAALQVVQKLEQSFLFVEQSIGRELNKEKAVLSGGTNENSYCRR
jgi:PAS domain S-box-containing protein